MKFYTGSAGILARKAQIEPMLGRPLHAFKASIQLAQDDVLVGWGQKANTRQIKQKAHERGLPYWQLEDGFIGYIGHPARGGKAVSLIADPVGIYYDARQPSRLEQLIATPCDAKMVARAEALTRELLRLGITKYNCYAADSGLPDALATRLHNDPRPKVLLIDQVAGDLSIPGALAATEDFEAMVAAARRNHPGARLLLRTHPDTRLGKKRGVLAQMQLDDVERVIDHCHPHALLNEVEAVYTVSSQMGFEALLLGKAVYCFGMPFYAGWGLTHDSKTCSRRQAQVSLPQLVAAALILYPRYLDPVLGQRCEVEQVLQIIAGQLTPAPRYRRLYMVGFSLWKRAFMRAFCQPLATELHFVRTPPAQLADDEQVLVWGSRYPELANPIRVEDGFIRSRGLGSNLCRPSSLSIDPVGIYFDSRRPSGLEQLLNQQPLSEQELERGAALVDLLRQHGVSKYNVGTVQPFTPPGDGRALVLVVGQVDGDASILTGSPVIRSNEQLLWAVRAARPDAHILFKPHPDVVAGNRAGAISAECLARCVDSQVLDLGLTSLYPHIDELHTMTSLSGFEALVQGVKVTTWGQPFYSGWGLTEDIHPAERRQRTLPLAALVYLTLVAYPRYIDWQSGLWMSPEQLIRQLAVQGNSSSQKASRWQRWQLKLSYLAQTLR
ncbi:capsular polysaccharide biosynthesis protein [Leclercia adecarboxylata]|uniref:Capsular polysaccharide biosynthesis protein n=1 Tax=Leclercia adecarboxylata TaxID=83655 RepID=A0A9X3YDC6_9ENTR|nr:MULTISPECIES: capsular polysaccharide biosynthesis protein [Leclercia]MBD1405744.1 capsular polysaccharide biosynthesis protein [Leclercia adecarboxylata]MDC6623882.1 capsular polysaccharide biosynthesis protein [Leclercia adecarboxylata]MDC6632704.1 capsular polysaccharide biosynthesis protein [Leclercia adecarboxylata]MDC6639889.1 capsular polysaccharide biosynthesis protein [Leclercia adecarboxylata]MDC6651618.1 capsular polysaccharide biosynthesis protein [Leclercia adecarboxylata]